jgi:sugar-specific transcriptional regulator TrmB
MQQKGISFNKSPNELRSTNADSATAAIIRYLQDFGLNERESKIYYILSKLGTATANEISSTSQYNRLQTYRSIKGLLDRGLVEISLERPRRYTPLKIEHAMNLLQQEAENRILQLESTKPLLLKEWAEIPDFPVLNNGYTFRIVQGSKNVFKFAVMLYESAEKNIDIVIKGNELMRWVLEGADDSLQKITNKQVTIRAMSEFDRSNIIGIRRFLEFSNLRHVPSIDIVPLVLIDGKEVLICLTNGRNGVPENAIWTNHPQFVAMQKSLFNFLWATSKDGNSMVEMIDRKGYSRDLIE